MGLHSDSKYCLPVVCAPKPHTVDEMQATINFQQTNKFTVKSEYQMPTLDGIFQKIKGNTFSTFDGEEGYHKVRMSKDSIKLNSLKAVGVTMSCNGMIGGMKNAGNHYQQESDKMLSKNTAMGVALNRFANRFVNDTIIYSNGMEEHIRQVDNILAQMLADNIKPKWRKAQFGLKRVHFGGRIVSKHGIEVLKDKAEIICQLRRPQGWKDVQRIYGMFLWHKQWINHFDQKAKPITRFLSGKLKHMIIDWDKDAERAYTLLCDDISKAVA